MTKATVTLSRKGAQQVRCRIVLHDRTLIGHRATFRLKRVVHVKDDRPVHKAEPICVRELVLHSTETTFDMPRTELGRGYAYQGHQIDIRLESELEIDDGLLFDTEINGVHRLNILDRPKIDGRATEIAEPKDRFDFFANLTAIPARNRLITLGLTFVGGIVILINAIVGLHDQFTPESQTLFYSHTNSDGEGQSPLMNALMGSGALGTAIWVAIRSQLRKYMRFELHRAPSVLSRETRLAAGELIRGRARVALQRVRVRVVAYNRELGQYIRGSGTQRRTVSFASPARAIVLYERFLPHVPARVPLETYLDGEVDFREMFAALYPPFKLGSSHGIDVCWEAQLLHPDFVDQEVVCSDPRVAYEDFLDD